MSVHPAPVTVAVTAHHPVPRVSVLMSFLDAAPFIREAIESVRAQTYRGWELLLIDDGSADGSAAIAREYARRYPDQIFCFEHPHRENRGRSAALNVGLRHARGDVIAILDADDVWLPGKLEAQLPVLDAHPDVGMLYSSTVFWHSWTAVPGRESMDTVPSLRVPVDTLAPPDLLARCITRKAAAPCTCSVLMRRAVVERVGGFEESFRRVYTDQALYAKMFLDSPVYVASGTWDKYRIHPASSVMTAKRSGTLPQAHRQFLEFLREYLGARTLTDESLRRAVRSELWRLRHPTAVRVLARARWEWTRARARLGAYVPRHWRPRVHRLLHPIGGVRFGSLRRLTPLSRHFGYDRGAPVDRYYIETFLASHAADIQGRVLEIGDNGYTRRFGGDRVVISDVLHVSDGHPGATIIDDLSSGEHIPSEAFDCVVLTQTMQLIFDVRAVVRTVHRILKPGGVLLVTVPGITQIESGRWQDSWYWGFTPASLLRLLRESFPATDVRVRSWGNVLAACAFLQGLAREELTVAELDAHDPLYPVIVAARARKPHRAGPE